MAWKSYRSHAQLGEGSPFGAIVAAFCIGLVFAGPWLLLALGLVCLRDWWAG